MIYSYHDDAKRIIANCTPEIKDGTLQCFEDLYHVWDKMYDKYKDNSEAIGYINKSIEVASKDSKL